jgi:hypothetical protein
MLQGRGSLGGSDGRTQEDRSGKDQPHPDSMPHDVAHAGLPLIETRRSFSAPPPEPLVITTFRTRSASLAYGPPMRWLIVALVLLLLPPAADPALAQSDPDRARSAVQAGEARPLGDILARIQGQYPGRVLDAQLGQRGQGWVYQIRILGPGGDVVELTVDARTGEVLQSRGGGRGRR